MKTKTKQTKITKLLDQLHKDVDKFYNSETWENYLKFMGMFIRRSVNNQLLIWFFGGEDTIQVMGYQQFINKLKDEISLDSNFVGIGAVFEWVAGTKVKAPEILANIGLEWIFRLLQEPKRLYKRYFIDNSLFIIYFIKQLRRK